MTTTADKSTSGIKISGIIILLTFFIECVAAAGVPTITSLSNTSGGVGTSVTIYGSNFSASAAFDTVYFGAVRANVTFASPTQLSVTVPSGATYQPISVSVNGLTAYSAAPFDVTFSGSHIIDTTSFALPVVFRTTSNQNQGITICDIDGDGKPDLIVCNALSESLSVYRNTSSSGSINAGSFAAPVNFFVDNHPFSVAAGDIDGDGKPDLVVANYGIWTLSVLRNTSTPGSISFDTQVEFNTAEGPYNVVIGDMDGDGKPDLIVANYGSNSASVFRNTAVAGSITSSSFATRVDYPTGYQPFGVAVGDIDGDGKPDIIVTNSNIFYDSGYVSVLRNKSIAGTITDTSFAFAFNFYTDRYPTYVAVSDLDGDGKPDLVVSNTTWGTLSIFRNTSIPDTIGASSFAPRVTLFSDGDPYGVAVADINGDGKPDIVSVNLNHYTVSVFRNISSPGSITSGSFAPNVNFKVGQAPYAIAVGDLDGDGKPDIAVTNYFNDTVSVIRNAVSAALPVELTSFTATAENGAAALEWKTATEVNNAGFEVQRQAVNSNQRSAASWGKIGFVEGNGTSNAPHTYSYADNVGGAATYSYRLKQIDHDGAFTYSVSAQVSIGVPKVLALDQNFPNPFNPSTNIQFTVPADGRAVLKVFNVLGQETATLFDGIAKAGEYHQTTFDASRLASGIYFSRLEFDGRMQLKKMLLLK